MRRIAVIRIAGKQGLTQEVKKTFKLLRLYNKYTCVLVPNTPIYIGMIKKVKDFVTWGEADEKTIKKLLEKRGKLARKISLTEEYIKEKTSLSLDDFVNKYAKGEKELKDISGLKLFFKLHPPLGGFEREGTKKHYSIGGVLGYRKDKINDLLLKMI